MPEDNKSPSQVQVDLDTSGPEVDVSLEETKEEAVVDTAPVESASIPQKEEEDDTMDYFAKLAG